MFRLKIILGLLISSLALLFPVGVFAQTNFISVEPSTRTVENPYLKVRWDMNNSERVSELIYKPFSTSYNLAESPDLNEFFGNAQAFHPTVFANEAGLVNSFNTPGSTWAYTNNGQTARVEIHSISEHGSSITTVYEIDGNNPVFKVTRTFGFGSQPLNNPSRVVPYFVRGYDRDDFTTYAWEKTDGTVGEIVGNCEFGCTPSDWAQSWFDLEAPGFNVGLGLINLQANPQSTPWLDRDMNSYSSFISASISNNGYTEDLTVSYLIVPHLGDYSEVNWGNLTAPFLDLPWRYLNFGQTFRDAAILNINSYFDHTYPLYSGEPVGFTLQTTTYTGRRGSTLFIPYSGHNGYDYDLDDGTIVVAPASGLATYLWDNDGGNGIVINHGNGFFTWFMHLRDDGLIVDSGSQSVSVSMGQQIGRVGNTGLHTTGPHLHMSVIRDLNGNGILDFGVDYPYGLVDPYGWRAQFADPWPLYGGSISSHLWINPISPFSDTIPPVGLELLTNWSRIIFPPDPLRPILNLFVDEQSQSNVSSTLRGIGPTFDIRVTDVGGNQVTSFDNPYSLIISYDGLDLSNILEETLSIFWFNTQEERWEPVPTAIDTINRTATAELNHASLFTLIGEVKDLTAPSTSASLEGIEGSSGWFNSDVDVTLFVQDNDGGQGVKYTYYSVNNEHDWDLYAGPLKLRDEGTYTVYFYSIDYGGNLESIQTVSFIIDQTSPEARMYYDTQGKKIAVEGVGEVETEVSEEVGGQHFSVRNPAGNTLDITGDAISSAQEDSFEAFSLNYSDGLAAGPLNRKLLILDYLDESQEQSRYLVQRWYMDYYARVEIVYKPLTNKSTIFIKEPGLPIQKETRDGLVLLHITTNRGSLEVDY